MGGIVVHFRVGAETVKRMDELVGGLVFKDRPHLIAVAIKELLERREG